MQDSTASEMRRGLAVRGLRPGSAGQWDTGRAGCAERQSQGQGLGAWPGVEEGPGGEGLRHRLEGPFGQVGNEDLTVTTRGTSRGRGPQEQEVLVGDAVG